MVRWMRVVVGLAVLAALYGLGEWLVRLLRVPFPGSLVGMVLCAALLAAGALPLAWVEEAADLLLRHMPLYFLPILAGLAAVWDLVRGSLGWALVAVVASTLAVLAVTGAVAVRGAGAGLVGGGAGTAQGATAEQAEGGRPPVREGGASGGP